jgi:hypothetical protein
MSYSKPLSPYQSMDHETERELFHDRIGDGIVGLLAERAQS